MYLQSRFLCFATALFLGFSGVSSAQNVGEDYSVVSPALFPDEAGKIEVIEFFSFGCPHCAEFSPLFNQWITGKPADVSVRKIPVSFGRAAWRNLSKLYYALEITGDLKRLEADVFRALQKEKIDLYSEKITLAWVSGRDVNVKKFTEAYNSFGVATKVTRGDQLAETYKISGVPAIAVAGQYLVKGKTNQDVLSITDKLIVKTRANKKPVK